REQRLPTSGRPDQQDIRLADLDLVLLAVVVQPFVMVVNGNREHLLCVLLTDHILIEYRLDLARSWQLAAFGVVAAFLNFFANDVVTKLDAFVNDENGGTGDELSYFVLALATERAVEQLACVVLARLVVSHSYTPNGRVR